MGSANEVTVLFGKFHKLPGRLLPGPWPLTQGLAPCET